ncbi:ribosomal L1 domain-containing protein 1 [Petromyzon marinus]|uniref:ribosomal L1 domain-containing protein 1 n=1 Tax=Petromyzon marinus TaxID=7757 RepID=UPI003F71A4AD
MATEKEHVCRTPGLNKCQVSLAIKALIEHQNKRPVKSEKKQPLFEVASRVQLMVTVWRIPPKDCVIKIGLPHSVRCDDVEVCLFTKDEPKMSPEQTCSHYTKLLQKSDIKSVTRVIPYQTLKKEYKPYEAKLKLLRSYDLFLADSRIRRLLPSHLGRHFYAAKKAPLSVNLLHKNLDRELGRFISGTALHVSNKGNCNTVLVGNTTMELNNIVENIMTVASTMAKKCPGGWGNVKVLHVKTQASVALPVYTASLDAIATVLNRKDLFKSTADEEKPNGERKKKKKKREELASPGDGSPAKKAKLQAEGELPTTDASDDTAGVKASTKSSAKKKKRDEAKESSVCVEEEEEVSAVEEDEVAVAAAKTPEETPSKKAKRNRRKTKNCTPTPAGPAAHVKEDDAEVKMDVEEEAAVVSFLSEIRKNTPLKTPTKKKTQKEEQTPSSGQGASGAKREKEEKKVPAIVVEGCAFPAAPLCGLPEKVLVKTPKRKGVKTPQKSTADTKQEAEKEDVVTACDVPASPVISVLSETPGKSTVKTPAKTPKQKRAKTPSKPASDDDVKNEEKIPESIDADAIPVMAPLSETPATKPVKTPAKTPKRKQPNTPSMPTGAKGSNGFEEEVSAARADHGEFPLVIELSDTEEATSTKTPNKTPKQKRPKTPSKPDAARDDDKKKVVDADLCQARIIIELSDTEETASKTRAETAKVSRAKTPAKRSVAALPAALSSSTEIKVGEESVSMAPHTGQAVESGNGREEGRNAGGSGPAQEEDDVVMELPARTPRRKAALAANEAIIVLNEKKRGGGRRTRASDASASETGSECGSDVGSGLEDCVAVGEWAARRGEGGRRRR